jgi:hypothetical protein
MGGRMIAAERVLAGPDLTPASILSRAVGPRPLHCAGYPLDPAGGYIAAPRLVAVARQADSRLHPGEDDVVTFDLAEETAGVRQINCMDVHSFCSRLGS